MKDPNSYTNKAGSMNKDMTASFSRNSTKMGMADAGVPETASTKDCGKSGTGGAKDGMLGKADDHSMQKNYGK